MLAKHKTIHAMLRSPCLACLGNEVDSYGRKCVGCEGEGMFFVPMTATSMDEVRDCEDTAWDFVATKITENGAEISDDALKYRIDNEYAELDGSVEVTLKIVPYPVSKATADYMNALVRK